MPMEGGYTFVPSDESYRYIPNAHDAEHQQALQDLADALRECVMRVHYEAATTDVSHAWTNFVTAVLQNNYRLKMYGRNLVSEVDDQLAQLYLLEQVISFEFLLLREAEEINENYPDEHPGQRLERLQTAADRFQAELLAGLKTRFDARSTVKSSADGGTDDLATAYTGYLLSKMEAVRARYKLQDKYTQTEQALGELIKDASLERILEQANERIEPLFDAQETIDQQREALFANCSETLVDGDNSVTAKTTLVKGKDTLRQMQQENIEDRTVLYGNAQDSQDARRDILAAMRVLFALDEAYWPTVYQEREAEEVISEITDLYLPSLEHIYYLADNGTHRPITHRMTSWQDATQVAWMLASGISPVATDEHISPFVYAVELCVKDTKSRQGLFSNFVQSLRQLDWVVFHFPQAFDAVFQQQTEQSDTYAAVRVFLESELDRLSSEVTSRFSLKPKTTRLESATLTAQLIGQLYEGFYYAIATQNVDVFFATANALVAGGGKQTLIKRLAKLTEARSSAVENYSQQCLEAAVVLNDLKQVVVRPEFVPVEALWEKLAETLRQDRESMQEQKAALEIRCLRHQNKALKETVGRLAERVANAEGDDRLSPTLDNKQRTDDGELADFDTFEVAETGTAGSSSQAGMSTF